MVSQITPDRSGRAGRGYRRVWWCLAITVAGAGSVISLLSIPGVDPGLRGGNILSRHGVRGQGSRGCLGS